MPVAACDTTDTRMSVEDDNRRIAAEWRAQVEFLGKIRKASNQAGSLGHPESAGYFITADALNGRRAYMKPTKKHSFRRAAREKIAADLAHDLGVNVPPVLLALNDAGAKLERFVSISLVLYPHQFSWGEMKVLLSKDTDVSRAVAPLLQKSCARALAFDTWLDQTDHNDHDANVQFGYEAGQYGKGRFIFLDYAFSMGVSGQWENRGYETCSMSPFSDLMCGNLDRGELAATVRQIEAFPEDHIRSVIDRIPWQYLRDGEEKQLIAEGLVARRRLVRAALGSYLPEGNDATLVRDSNPELLPGPH